MHNLINGVLLYTLKFLLLGRDLFLTDLVVARATQTRPQSLQKEKILPQSQEHECLFTMCSSTPQEQVSRGAGAAKVSAGAGATNSTLEESAAQETEGTSMISGIM